MNSHRFGILDRTGECAGELHWVKGEDAMVALGDPGRLAYADRACAEQDHHKMRVKYPKSDLTIVEATPDDQEDRFRLLAEGRTRGSEKHIGIECSIWNAVNAFNKAEIARGAPPVTCDEMIRALAWAVRYALIYLGCAGHDEYVSDSGGCEISLLHPDSKEVSVERFVSHLGGMEQ